MTNKETRQAKLHAKYRVLRNHWRGGKEVPWLNVSGVWLEKAGFDIGDAIEISVGSKVLIIKKLPEDGHSND